MKRVTEDQVKILRDLRTKQDQTVMALGVTQIEYESRKEFFVQTIAKTKEQQRKAGEHLLRMYGITNEDLERDEYTIDLETGRIKILIAGQWKEVE